MLKVMFDKALRSEPKEMCQKNDQRTSGWLARNEGMDPDGNPHITHRSRFHACFHSLIPS